MSESKKNKKVVKKASFEKADKMLNKNDDNNKKKIEKTNKSKDETIEKQEKIDNSSASENISETKPEITLVPKKMYFSYQFRVFLHSTLLVVLIAIFCFSLFRYIKVNSADVVNYTENGNANYRVLLKDNKYYDDKYVDQDMMYVANLISKIDINFDYDFVIDREIDCNFIYDISAYLVIKDGVSDKAFFNRKYDIFNNNSEEMKNSTKHSFKKNIKIDYQYYNLLASKFKGDLGVDTESYLRVMFTVKKESDGVSLKDSSTYIDIPLSQRSFNITISPMKLNNYSQTVREKNYETGDKKYLALLIVVSVLILLVLYRLIKLISKSFRRRSKYQRYISKLLREYDRLIVEIVKSPDFSGLNVTKVSAFKELLDVRDNLKLPIMYHEIVKNQKAYFYIQNDNNVYLYVVKEVDMK